MKKSYEKILIESCLKKTKYQSNIKNLREFLFVARYNKGEFVTSPLQKEQLFQIVVEGSLNIYYIRDDGSVYCLSNGQQDYLLGEMEIFGRETGNVYAEANEDLVCLALSIDELREKLLTDCLFLQLICQSLTQKLEIITTMDAASSSLKQRVLTYMRYKCPRGELKGLHQAAFRLNCSVRQLQRILNQYESEEIVRKTGKGSYKLNPSSLPYPFADTDELLSPKL